MNRQLSRRDFLKISALSMGGLAFRRWLPVEDRASPLGVGRVTVAEINVRNQPSRRSEIVAKRYRDQLVSLFEEVISPSGPLHNPRWYRLTDGYAHSAYLQRVETAHLNPPMSYVALNGRLGEVTVPFAQTMRWTKDGGWTPLYRLYFQSVHRFTAIEEGPDGEAWYRITDELLRLDYHVPAIYLRPIPDAELSPISAHLPWQKKRIEVSLPDQTLTAFEDGKVVLHTKISSGMRGEPPPGEIPTATPSGKFTIGVKIPSKHMGDGLLTEAIDAYELPGVPWTCFFAPHGIAFHGTYWHDNFGTPMSHGCINMRTEEAKWLYRWSLPETKSRIWEKRGYGTRVDVF
jgi:hypothetical protein